MLSNSGERCSNAVFFTDSVSELYGQRLYAEHKMCASIFSTSWFRNIFLSDIYLMRTTLDILSEMYVSFHVQC
jgi:hypothetical protein